MTAAVDPQDWDQFRIKLDGVAKSDTLTRAMLAAMAGPFPMEPMRKLVHPHFGTSNRKRVRRNRKRKSR